MASKWKDIEYQPSELLSMCATVKRHAMYKQYNLKDETSFKIGTHALRAFRNRKSPFEVCVTYEHTFHITREHFRTKLEKQQQQQKHANLINIL